MSRKIILNLAISLDGYIADEQGGFKWIEGHGDPTQNTEGEFDFANFLESIDVLIMGRKAYEDCGTIGYETKKIIVATTQSKTDYENVVFVKDDICKYVQGLQKLKGKDIWIFGGGLVADCFIKENIIDQYIIGIIPVILGKGRRLFLANNPTIKLHLDECTVNDGIPILKYSKKQ